jgi:tetratricopeptide (TPR) repeat protein
LRPWAPQAGYLDHLRRAARDQRYAVYLEERPDHLRQPGFFLDAAEFFFAQEDTATALRVLSNLAELELDDPALLRVLAHRLVQAGRPDLAAPLFERVLALRPEEPQSRRDLALTCADLKRYQHAVDLLWEIVSRPWDARFPAVELIALSELNAIATTCGQPVNLSQIDPRLRKNLPVGLRAVLTWDADNCDIDLWVVDPNGETAKYDHPLTYQGGRMSKDFTQGYGPEEFILRNPKPGAYQVKINYYGDRRQTAIGPVTVQARLITDFGLPSQKEERITVRLVDRKETLDIGSIEIGARK